MHTTFLLLTLCTLAAPLHAAGPDSAFPYVFSVHDLDRDGYLSPDEYVALRTQCRERSREPGASRGHAGGRFRCALYDFSALDADQDGRIGEDELLAALGRRHRGGGTSGQGAGRSIITPPPPIDTR